MSHHLMPRVRVWLACLMTAGVLLAGASSAFANITIIIDAPSLVPPPATPIVGEPVAISVRVPSTSTVTSVQAAIAGRTTALGHGTTGWSGSLSLDGLARGNYDLIVTATNSGGESAQVTRTITYDKLPVLTVTAPVPNTVGEPDVRVTASCTDDGPTCLIRVGPSNTAGALIPPYLAVTSGTIDMAVRPPDGKSFLIIDAIDSTGQLVTASVPVFVPSNQQVRPLASFTGGEIVAIDATRVLLLDGSVSPRVLRLVDRTTLASQIIWTGTAANDIVIEAFLTPTGAIFSTSVPGQIQHPILEWRSGTLVDLGIGSATTLVAAGAWAIWIGYPPPGTFATLMLRDLTAGTTTPVSTAAAFNDNDVAANGYVAFWAGSPPVPGFPPAAPFEIHDYVPGPPPSSTQLTTSAPIWSIMPKTDGANVVFQRLVSASGAHPASIVLRTQAGTEVVLATDLFSLSVPTAYHIANGWVAFVRKGTGSSIQAWRRAPDGSEQQLSDTTGTVLIDAINEHGDVVFTESVSTGGDFEITRYLVRPGQPRVNLGERFGTPVSIDGDWFITAANNVLAIEPAIARSILAEGATGSFFTTDVAILNPNSAAVPVTIKYLREGASPIEETRTLAARSRITLHENEISGLEAAAVSTVVEASDGSPLVVERLMSWDATGYGGHLASAVDRPRLRWLFAEGAQGGFDTFFLLANSETTDATVRFTHLVEGGAPVTRTVAVPAGARVTAWAGDVPALINSSFATVIDSDVPIVAERAMYFGSSPLWVAGHGTAGVAEPSTTWFHAEGATGSFFDTYILLGNPNARAVNVTITFVTDANQTFMRFKIIPPLSRLTINIEDELPGLAGAVSTSVFASDYPIVSERAMYWGLQALGWREAHDSFGVTSRGVRWGLAEGRAGGDRGYQTFVLVSNVATRAAPVKATFIREVGQIIERVYNIGAEQRFTIDASGIPELANSNFGTIIESTDGVPISVESAIYWSVNGVLWEGGGNTTATRLP